MVAALSGAPTRSRRSCKHRTSRWMARHGEIRVPSILAAAQEYLGGKKTVNSVPDCCLGTKLRNLLFQQLIWMI